MKKYAKIINEETKQCEVGLGDPEAIYYEEIISDENGDKKIIHKVKEYYQEIGYEIKDVEEGYDGNWYLVGYAPTKPAPTKEEQQQARQEAYKNEVDPITCHIQRLNDEVQTEDIIAEIASLVEERKSKVAEIKARYPYPESDQVSDQPTDQVDDKLSPVDTVNDTVSELEK